MDSLRLDSHRLEVGSPSHGSGANGVPVDSANLRAVKEVFRALTEEGVMAGVESLLGFAHEDCEFRPYMAGQQVLRGRDAIRDFFRHALGAGASITARPQSFEDNGEEIAVIGSARVQRPTGGFAESQVRWTFRFRDGVIDEAHWGPRHGA